MTAAALPVLMVGAGKMAIEYAKVLKALGHDQIVLGRGAASAKAFEDAVGIRPSQGDLAAQLSALRSVPETAIVTVNAMHLAEVTEAVLRAGVRRVLVEKPAALDLVEADSLNAAATAAGAEVFVAYNRRFLASTLRADEIIAADGGVLSVKFDFSERARSIATMGKPQRELDTWFFGNSTHVVDLAFHFFGPPITLSAEISGGISWHKAAGWFTGHARNASGGLMTWHANWMAPGRWGCEVLTAEHRLIMQPLEKLRVQSHEGFAETEVALDDTFDLAFKPGLMRQTRAFLYGEMAERLPSLSAHVAAMRYYDVIRTGGRFAANTSAGM